MKRAAAHAPPSSDYGPSPVGGHGQSDYGYGGNDDGGGIDEYRGHNRPRRPNPDTVSYLLSLPLDVRTAREELDAYLRGAGDRAGKGGGGAEMEGEHGDAGDDYDEDPEDRLQMLAAATSAIGEVENELASLAGDERASIRVEELARIVECGLRELSPAVGGDDGPTATTAEEKSAAVVCRERRRLWSRCARSARRMLRGLSGYHLHLACHRYGSHVSQTVLAVCGEVAFEADDDDDDDDDDAEEDEDGAPPSAETLVLNAAEELVPCSQDLARHVCGSHVLRTLLCVLAGATLTDVGGAAAPGGQGGDSLTSIELRGGPKGKKKKKKKKARGPDADGGGDGSSWHHRHQRQVQIRVAGKTPPRGFPTCLATLIRSLAPGIGPLAAEGGGRDVPSGQMTRGGGEEVVLSLLCHPSAGPLLTLLLRVLAAVSSSASTTDAKAPLHHPPRTVTGEGIGGGGDFRLGILPPEPLFAPESDAHRLVRHVLCWDDDEIDGDGETTTATKCGEVLYGLSGETYGSRFLEAVLSTCPDDFHDELCSRAGLYRADTLGEYAAHDVSNFVLQVALRTARVRTQVERFVRGLTPLVSDGTLLGRRRGGVLWRLTEMSAGWRIGQETLLKAISTGFGSVDGAGRDGDGGDASKRGRKRTTGSGGARALPTAECVKRLLSCEMPEVEGGRLGVDANGARTVHHLLRFVPRLCTDVLGGIVMGYDQRALVAIAKDGLASRCIMDGILEGPTEEVPFSRATRDLLDKLAGCLVELAVDRVGHHTVEKLFKALTSTSDKAALTEELSRGRARLGGNAMGRSVMEKCFVHQYLEGENAWKDAVRKQEEKDNWMKDITAAGNQDGGRKRRRKRKGAVSSRPDSLENDATLDACVDNDVAGKPGKSTSAVEDIMKVISSVGTSLSNSEFKTDEGEKPKKKRKREKKRPKALPFSYCLPTTPPWRDVSQARCRPNLLSNILRVPDSWIAILHRGKGVLSIVGEAHLSS